jgi:MFS family permease
MPESREPYSTRQRWLITFTVMNGAVMGSLDANIVNVALPHMRGALGASVEEIVWVSTGYILSSVIVMPSSPPERGFGRRRFYIFSVVLFTVASTLCGFPGHDYEVTLGDPGNRGWGLDPPGAGYPTGNIPLLKDRPWPRVSTA